MTIKTQYNLSEAGYNEIMNLLHEVIGDEAAKDVPKNFYRSKKFVHSLGMPYVKIDACPNGCMIYYKTNKDKESCSICGESRYEEPTRGKKSRKVPKKSFALPSNYSKATTPVHVTEHGKAHGISCTTPQQ